MQTVDLLDDEGLSLGEVFIIAVEFKFRTWLRSSFGVSATVAEVNSFLFEVFACGAGGGEETFDRSASVELKTKRDKAAW